MSRWLGVFIKGSVDSDKLLRRLAALLGDEMTWDGGIGGAEVGGVKVVDAVCLDVLFVCLPAPPCISLCVCVCVCVCVCIFLYFCMYMYFSKFLYVCVHVWVCLRVCMCVCVHFVHP